MSSYSVDGYLALTKMRETKSLLVEGISDMKVLARLIRELEDTGVLQSDTVKLDLISALENNDGRIPEGNREAVEYVVALAAGERLPLRGVVVR